MADSRPEIMERNRFCWLINVVWLNRVYVKVCLKTSRFVFTVDFLASLMILLHAHLVKRRQNRVVFILHHHFTENVS